MAERSLALALVQVNAGTEVEANLATLGPMVDEAAATGAHVIATPENVAAMVTGRQRTFARAWPEGEHPAYHWFSARAARHGVWLLAGSLAVLVDEGERVANRSLLFAPDGSLAARYDKIHMFDVDLPGGESYRESNTYRPGERAVRSQGPAGWQLGLTICFDLRFPQLYRQLAQAGAELLLVPSAFTAQTGQAHWHTLLRARAIETGCFVAAPAQTDTHDRGRQTYGHSLVVAPWGEVLADGGEGTGLVTAQLDPDRIAAARRAVPAIHGDRAFTPPEPAGSEAAERARESES